MPRTYGQSDKSRDFSKEFENFKFLKPYAIVNFQMVLFYLKGHYEKICFIFNVISFLL